jgi:hypothetical protein
MSKKQLAEVVIILDTVQTKLQRIEEYVQAFDPTKASINRLKSRQQILEGIGKEFEETQYEYEILDSKNDEMKQTHIRSRIAFENKYCDIMSDMMDIIDKVENSSISHSNTAPTSGNAAKDVPFNLPVINLETFSGSYKDWTNFENCFKSVIDENKSLKNRQKLQYLKSSLREEALRAVESLSILDENYDKAWEILINRFKNTRLIVQDYVASILNASPISKQSHSHLRELLNTITTNIAALKTLKIPVDSWDALIIPIISEKLDYVTKKEWQTSLDTSVPTYNEFVKFLEKRCTGLESLNSLSTKSSNQATNNSLQKSNQSNKRTVTLAATNKITSFCTYCKNSAHLIHQCDEFSNLSVQSRNEKARAMKLCLNCLRNNHTTSDCRNTAKCRNCNKNTICYCTLKILKLKIKIRVIRH